MSGRTLSISVLLYLILWGGIVSATFGQEISKIHVEASLKEGILEAAFLALDEIPITVTADISSRSAGGIHDFFSEGDYWWPDPENPEGPYIQRDGMTNPENFTAHRLAMIRFSKLVGSLASAYKITGDDRFAIAAFRHLEAWFVNPETRMNPSLNYAQAITGRVTGRGIGIIDTIHLMEVAQGLLVIQDAPSADVEVVSRTKAWFAEYLDWLTTHPFGDAERETLNNHATCYYMQVAAFARLTENKELLEECSSEFKNRLLPNQMATDGSFPLEIRRTKPFGYSLFNLDAMTTLAWILSSDGDDLMKYRTSQGKSISKGAEFLFPFVKDKTNWPFEKDVMYWEDWPIAQPFLIFSAISFQNQSYFELWNSLDHSPESEEIVRNFPIRNPLIWMK